MDEKKIEQAFEVFAVVGDLFGQYDPACIPPGKFVTTYIKVCLN